MLLLRAETFRHPVFLSLRKQAEETARATQLQTEYRQKTEVDRPAVVTRILPKRDDEGSFERDPERQTGHSCVWCCSCNRFPCVSVGKVILAEYALALTMPDEASRISDLAGCLQASRRLSGMVGMIHAPHAVGCFVYHTTVDLQACS